jgi:hypothetical protein
VGSSGVELGALSRKRRSDEMRVRKAKVWVARAARNHKDRSLEGGIQRAWGRSRPPLACLFQERRSRGVSGRGDS